MSRDNIAITSDGRILPLSSDEVGEIARRAVLVGRIRAVLVERENGDLVLQVLGDPDRVLGEQLMAAGRAYLRGFGQ